MTRLFLFLNALTASVRDRADRDDRGAGLVEYALLVSLIALACILALTGLGTAIANKFTSITGKL
jgi:pilus assembly protein Flp/PilA